MNVSFFYLPWLDLSPLKESLWGDALGIAPDAAGQMLAWRGMDSAAHKMDFLASVVRVFEPPGWATLFLTSPHWLLTLLLLGIGIVIITLAVLITWQPKQPPVLGYALSICTAVLLFIIIYFLPEIEGLGEHSLPNILAIAIPLLRVEIAWLGPLVMMLGLLFLLAGGLAHGQQAGLDDLDSMVEGE